MVLLGESPREELVGLNIISSTFLVEILVVSSVQHVDFKVVFTQCSKLRQSHRSNSIGTVNCSPLNPLPFQIGGSSGEMAAELTPELRPDLLRINYLLLVLHVAKIHCVDR